MSLAVPHAPQAEAAVLGCLLRDSRLMPDDLDVAAFFDERHRLVFGAIAEVVRARQVVDVVTVAERLGKMLEAVGGPVFLTDLQRAIGTVVGFRSYLEQVRSAYRLRLLIDAATAIATRGYEAEDWESYADEAEARMARALADVRKGQRSEVCTIADKREGVLRAFEDRAEGRVQPGESTGLKTLDAELAGGGKPGDLILVAGRPAMGKSALVMGMQRSAAKRGRRVLVFCFEMSPEALVHRVWSAESGVPIPWLLNPRASDAQAMRQAVEGLASLADYDRNMLILSHGGPRGIPLIRSEARRAHAEAPLAMVVVDYLQQVQGDRRLPREQQVAEISRELKALAQELNVPVVALSQLSRACETRSDKRPMLSDLRESGAIEQDADVVMFLYRDEYYDPGTADKGIAEVIIAKQRNGPTGTVRLAFVDRTASFADLARTSFPTGPAAQWTRGEEAA